MKSAIAKPGPPELRDYYGRLIEANAPCDVRYYGTWHRGVVDHTARKWLWVEVRYPRRGRALVSRRRPADVAVLGATREDVESGVRLPAPPRTGPSGAPTPSEGR